MPCSSNSILIDDSHENAVVSAVKIMIRKRKIPDGGGINIRFKNIKMIGPEKIAIPIRYAEKHAVIVFTCFILL